MEKPPFRHAYFEAYNIYRYIFKFFPHLLEELRHEYSNNSNLYLDVGANNLDDLFYWADTNRGHSFWCREHKAYNKLRRLEEL